MTETEIRDTNQLTCDSHLLSQQMVCNKGIELPGKREKNKDDKKKGRGTP